MLPRCRWVLASVLRCPAPMMLTAVFAVALLNEPSAEGRLGFVHEAGNNDLEVRGVLSPITIDGGGVDYELARTSVSLRAPFDGVAAARLGDAALTAATFHVGYGLVISALQYRREDRVVVGGSREDLDPLA